MPLTNYIPCICSTLIWDRCLAMIEQNYSIFMKIEYFNNINVYLRNMENFLSNVLYHSV